MNRYFSVTVDAIFLGLSGALVVQGLYEHSAVIVIVNLLLWGLWLVNAYLSIRSAFLDGEISMLNKIGAQISVQVEQSSETPKTEKAQKQSVKKPSAKNVVRKSKKETK